MTKFVFMSILPSYSKINPPIGGSLHLRLKDQHLLVKDEIDLNLLKFFKNN